MQGIYIMYLCIFHTIEECLLGDCVTESDRKE